MNKNIYSLQEYLYYGALNSIMALLWYRWVLFKALFRLTTNTSYLLLAFSLAATLLLFGLVFFKERRNKFTLVAASVLPLGIYTFLAYWKLYGGFYKIVILLFVLAMAGYFIYVFTRRISNPAKKKMLMKKRIRFCMDKAFAGFVFLMAFGLLPILKSAYFTGAVLNSSVAAEKGSGQRELQETDQKALELLSPESWSALSLQEKLDVLQIVANTEARYLGVSNELNVVGSNLDEHTIASYDDGTHTIRVNMTSLETASPSEMVVSICHEAYHSYEHRLADIYDHLDEEDKKLMWYRKASEYADNSKDYVRSNENVVGYYMQPLEADAREYSNQASLYYLPKTEAQSQESQTSEAEPVQNEESVQNAQEQPEESSQEETQEEI